MADRQIQIMNIPIKDQPAFPTQWFDFQPETGHQVVREQFFGISIRHYLAGKALTSIRYNEAYDTPERVAETCLAIADAIIKQDQKQ